MAEYAAVELTGSSEDASNPHGAVELSADRQQYANADIIGTYPYEPTIRVYVTFAATGDEQEDVYTSAGGLAGNYLGSVEIVSPVTIRLRVRRLGGWPLGAITVYVERS
jgi:hypothetical protein